MWFDNFIIQDRIIESAENVKNKIEPVDLPKKENFELGENEVLFKREPETVDYCKGKLNWFKVQNVNYDFKKTYSRDITTSIWIMKKSICFEIKDLTMTIYY